MYLLSIYFWPHWLFSAVHGLSLAGASDDLVVGRGLFTAVASPMEEHRLQSLQRGGSVISGPRLYSVGLVVVVHRLSCRLPCGIFPDQGSNLSLALAGRFSTTGPPGKSHLTAFGED